MTDCPASIACASNPGVSYARTLQCYRVPVGDDGQPVVSSGWESSATPAQGCGPETTAFAPDGTLVADPSDLTCACPQPQPECGLGTETQGSRCACVADYCNGRGTGSVDASNACACACDTPYLGSRCDSMLVYGVSDWTEKKN